MAIDPGKAGEGLLDTLLLKLRARDVLTEEEEAVLAGSVDAVKVAQQDRLLVRAGVTLSHSTLLVDGFACRYKDLADGQRQIMDIHVPGDFVDLHGFLLNRLEHNLGSLTPVKLATVPHDRLRVITEQHPHLARMLWFSTLLDAAIHRERILSVGRRSALARIAHLLCELNLRLEAVGMAADGRYKLPLTQGDIADATGLTAVHVNRMLKQLRDQQLLTFRGGEVVIEEWDRLQRVAEFNSGYLYLERRPR
ncbi:MAG TPA: Crp/Fnr family transcriptional regulator [Allosphingosinicella sp.]